MDIKELKNNYDLSGDSNITDEEIEKVHKIRELENIDEKSDAQRKMAWFALFGMILYPLGVILSSIFGFENAANLLSGMSATYFGSVAVIIAAFYGSEAYKNH